MEKLKQRISNAVENELSKVYDELRIDIGDIAPDQAQKWERLTSELAELFAELIEQNK